MDSWTVATHLFASALVVAGLLTGADRLGTRLGETPSTARTVVGVVVLLLGLGAAVLLRHGPAFIPVAALTSAIGLTLAAADLHGGAGPRRIAVLSLYALVLTLSAAAADGSGMLRGPHPTPTWGVVLQGRLAELALPFLDLIPGQAPAWAAPTAVVAAVARQLQHELVLFLALGSLAVATFAAAHLTDRPLAMPGLELLPSPTSVALLWGLGWAADHLGLVAGPALLVVRWALIALTPLLIASAVALLSRWLAFLRTRRAVLILVALAALVFDPVLPALTALGWVAQLARLRELLPFAAQSEVPLRRPSLARLLSGAFAATLLTGVAAGLSWSSVRAATPLLGAGTRICAGIVSAPDWERRTLAVSASGLDFAIDLDERRAPTPTLSALTGVCEARGMRVCTSDEWYLACLCTFPVESDEGLKLSENPSLIQRAGVERELPLPTAETYQPSHEKRLPLSGLLTGRAELTSSRLGGSSLVAGPADSLELPHTVDCRTRALTSDPALAAAGGAHLGVRCCADRPPLPGAPGAPAAE